MAILAFYPNLLTFLVSVIFFPLSIHYYSLETLSSLILIITFSSFGTAYCFGADKLLLRHLTEKQKLTKTKLRLSFYISTINTLGFFLIFYLFYKFLNKYFSNFNIDTSISFEIFMLLCASTVILTLSRTSLWAAGKFQILSWINNIFSASHSIILLLLFAVDLRLDVNTFLLLVVLLRFSVASITVFHVTHTYAALENTQASNGEQHKYAYKYWCKSFHYFFMSLINIANDNIERLFMLLINPVWGALFITGQSTMSKISMITQAANLSVYLGRKGGTKEVFLLIKFYLVIFIACMLLIFLLKKIIINHIFLNSISNDDFGLFFLIGGVIGITASNQMLATKLERSGNLRKNIINELTIIISFSMIYFSQNSPPIETFLIIYGVKELLFKYTKLSALGIPVSDILKFLTVPIILYWTQIFTLTLHSAWINPVVTTIAIATTVITSALSLYFSLSTQSK